LSAKVIGRNYHGFRQIMPSTLLNPTGKIILFLTLYKELPFFIQTSIFDY